MVAAWRVPLANYDLCGLIFALCISGTHQLPTIWINYKQTQRILTRLRDSAQDATFLDRRRIIASFIVGMEVFLLGPKQAAYVDVSISSRWQLPMHIFTEVETSILAVLLSFMSKNDYMTSQLSSINPGLSSCFLRD